MQCKKISHSSAKISKNCHLICTQNLTHQKCQYLTFMTHFSNILKLDLKRAKSRHHHHLFSQKWNLFFPNSENVIRRTSEVALCRLPCTYVRMIKGHCARRVSLSNRKRLKIPTQKQTDVISRLIQTDTFLSLSISISPSYVSKCYAIFYQISLLLFCTT